MACQCIERFDEVLKPHNTKLALSIIFKRDENRLDAVPTIMTKQIETGRGKKKAVAVSPTYCPFCGVRYEPASVDEHPEGENSRREVEGQSPASAVPSEETGDAHTSSPLSQGRQV